MKAQFILNGRAKVYPPTARHATLRVVWVDPVTGKRRQTSASDYADAEIKARQGLGDYIPDIEQRVGTPPTFDEAFHSWFEANRHRWVPRTASQYEAMVRRYSRAFGDSPVTQITPKAIHAVDVTELSQGQQSKARMLIRSTFEQAKPWVGRNPEEYGNAVPVGGSKSNRQMAAIPTGDIPSARYVSACINLAYSTCQCTPLDRADTQINQETGEKYWTDLANAGHRQAESLNGDPLNLFTLGLPRDIIDHARLRRGEPKRWKLDPVKARERHIHDTTVLAKRFRQSGLEFALGAGAGLRIGELLALRVEHLLSEAQCRLMFTNTNQRGTIFYDADQNTLPWRGVIHVHEQISDDAGHLLLSAPKSRRERVVHVPAFMPNWNGCKVGHHRQQIAAIIPRFNDEHLSLWQANEHECCTLWQQGFIPLGWLLTQHLHELWHDPCLPEQPTTEPQLLTRIRLFRRLLLFPAGSRSRTMQHATVQVEEGTHFNPDIVNGACGYQRRANIANKEFNPLFDYVSSITGSYPEHRQNAKTRRGWSFHAMRHYAATSRIAMGVPLPLIAQELGHNNPAFTLARYAYAMPDAIDETIGFEY
jgi:integrase